MHKLEFINDKDSQEKLTIFTIGHSNHSLDMFIDLLKSHKIDVLVDVRSKPFSQFSPQFNEDPTPPHEKWGLRVQSMAPYRLGWTVKGECQGRYQKKLFYQWVS
jgi:hypothetical protein